ncbi:MAG TPA: GFA family protein [Rudaea sp.]
MKLEGSCHCGAVRFSVDAYAPVPFLYCYCSICRKTAGGAGCAVNLGARMKTLKVRGKQHLKIYRAKMREDGKKTTISSGQRNFCGQCGSCLWLYDPQWPDLVHPFASAIDTPLPTTPERVHMMLDFKAPWVEVPRGRREKRVAGYPKESLEDWHRRHGLLA